MIGSEKVLKMMHMIADEALRLTKGVRFGGPIKTGAGNVQTFHVDYVVLETSFVEISDYKLSLNSFLFQTKTRQDIIVSLSVDFLQILKDLSSCMNHLRQPRAVSTIDSVSLEVVPQVANPHSQKGSCSRKKCKHDDKVRTSG